MQNTPRKTNTPKKRLVLLDAHAILHRGYHALPAFTSQSGEHTGALYGLSSMLLKIIKDLKPDYIIAAYDLPGGTHRHEVYEEYKATRKEVDDELIEQIKRSRDIFEAFSIPIYEKAGFEADDVIGTIVDDLKDRDDIETVIASGDNDTLQLVSGKKVQVYTLRKGIKDTIVYDEEGVKERFGFAPELLPDFKGLSGDPSDNIPGVSGVGVKTATELISKFGGIEDIYKKLKKDEDGFREKGIKERAIKLLKEGEEEAKFSRMLAEIRRDAPIRFSVPKDEWKESLDIEKVVGVFKSLSFRTLTTRLRGVFGDGVDINTSEGVQEDDKSESIPENELKEVAVGLWILNSETTNPDEEDIFKFSGTRSFKKAKEHIFKELEKQKLNRVYEEIERPLIPVVEKMEERGIKIDKDFLKKLSEEYHKELSLIEKRIYKHAGVEFNINSPKQLSEILFDKLNLRIKGGAKTSTGRRSTRESELLKLKDEHRIVEEILKHRELQKLLSTYIDNIPGMVGGDGRLHARFLQSGTTTGRMSSQSPNLQNIPIKTELGKRIREAFVAEGGYKLAAFDYSQIELRVAAFLSGDKNLIDIFNKGRDIHTKVASEVFGVKEDEVDSEMRRKAKVINFGIQYGMGANALSKNIGSTRADAQKFLDEYRKSFPGLIEYFDTVKGDARRKGYTETFFGRRRLLPGMSSNLPYVRAEAERMALNAPIQGTQADIVKIAMVRIDEYIKKKGLSEQAHLVLQIHDELIYEIKKDKIDLVLSEIKGIMESILSEKDTKGVRLVADVSLGESWGSMKSLKK